VFAFGQGLVVTFTGDDAIRDYISDYWDRAEGETYRLNEPNECVYADEWHKEAIVDGAWVFDLELEQCGVSDWDDRSPEYDLQFTSCRRATKEEWDATLRGEYPWDPKEVQ
jgi:hypothetical protein